MLRRHQAGAYLGGWAPLREDMDTMFKNAMIFNAPDTVYHKQAMRSPPPSSSLCSMSCTGRSRGATGEAVDRGWTGCMGQATSEGEGFRPTIAFPAYSGHCVVAWQGGPRPARAARLHSPTEDARR